MDIKNDPLKDLAEHLLATVAILNKKSLDKRSIFGILCRAEKMYGSDARFAWKHLRRPDYADLPLDQMRTLSVFYNVTMNQMDLGRRKRKIRSLLERLSAEDRANIPIFKGRSIDEILELDRIEYNIRLEERA